MPQIDMFPPPTEVGSTLYGDDVEAIIRRIVRQGRPEDAIAFYGSSSFLHWTRLCEDLGTTRVVNLGFGGGTYATALHYFDRLLVPLKPARIVLYFGENDISNDGLTAESTYARFKMLIARITASLGKIPVFCLSTKQSPGKWIYAGEVSDLNQRIAAACETIDHLHFVDVGSALIGENGKPMSRYFIADKVHINDGGYAMWARILKSTPGLL
ncbi:GDSL-type esterase/lipase family protein [Roseibium litorale]|uniref:Lysophospholipase n=1 Tax=Roseibium litorale TaxID=2803841 RepID=A0ABR9CS12_9HYPH|nr:GDSL-type esterase/lipase family protein [Roseibium litorale]MBD8893672.1 lysophospholipase [Roseibium litorale]